MDLAHRPRQTPQKMRPAVQRHAVQHSRRKTSCTRAVRFCCCSTSSWRNSINRFAEAMTLFAVACAGMFPMLHLGRPVAVVLALPVSQHDGDPAEFPQPAGVGRVRGLHLRDGLAAVLVRRPDARSGHAARPRRASRAEGSLTAFWPWDGAVRRRHWAFTKRRRCCWPAWRRRWCSRSTPSSASTSRSRSFPAGTARSSRPTSSRAPSIRGFAMVLALAIPLREVYGLQGPDHRQAPG